MPFVEPGAYSKAELDRAGNRIRLGEETPTDIGLLENWRASHLYVINTFQSSLRSRRAKVRDASSITVAQRLKRRPTIVDKLSREEGMSLSRMHDIAGCRLIFPNLASLGEFRNGVLSSKAAHELDGNKERYDDISSPKDTGYRGIHDVYKYKVKSQKGVKWNGLRVKLQYRTSFSTHGQLQLRSAISSTQAA